MIRHEDCGIIGEVFEDLGIPIEDLGIPVELFEITESTSADGSCYEFANNETGEVLRIQTKVSGVEKHTTIARTNEYGQVLVLGSTSDRKFQIEYISYSPKGWQDGHGFAPINISDTHIGGQLNPAELHTGISDSVCTNGDIYEIASNGVLTSVFHSRVARTNRCKLPGGAIEWAKDEFRRLRIEEHEEVLPQVIGSLSLPQVMDSFGRLFVGKERAFTDDFYSRDITVMGGAFKKIVDSLPQEIAKMYYDSGLVDIYTDRDKTIDILFFIAMKEYRRIPHNQNHKFTYGKYSYTKLRKLEMTDPVEAHKLHSIIRVFNGKYQ